MELIWRFCMEIAISLWYCVRWKFCRVENKSPTRLHKRLNSFSPDIVAMYHFGGYSDFSKDKAWQKALGASWRNRIRRPFIQKWLVYIKVQIKVWVTSKLSIRSKHGVSFRVQPFASLQKAQGLSGDDEM